MSHPVEGITCPCAGTPHPDGDTVHLKDKLSLPAGIEIQKGVRLRVEEPDEVITGWLVNSYVRHGIESWTFLDDKGGPIPVTPENVQRIVLDDFALAMPIAEAADTLYEDAVLGPLVREAANLSPTTPTGSSTSATDSGSDESPTQSPPSSTSTTPTAVTVKTSPWPVGGYRSSQIEPTDLLREAG